MPTTNLGEPLSAVISLSGGTAQLFQLGAVITRSGVETTVVFVFPMIGRPHITVGDAASAQVLEHGAIAFRADRDAEDVGRLVREALAGRIGLIPGGLDIAATAVVDLHPATPVEGVPGMFYLPAFAALLNRQLHDVALRDDGGTWHVAAPNAVYSRWSWHDFGIAHVTDIHVARRIDYFRDRLRHKDRGSAAEKMYNWNDRFRGFIRYANYLHTNGLLDVILATGDLFDYGFEDDDDPAGAGNAGFFRGLVLGECPGPDFPDVERLNVPIFTVSGNHDLRAHPYTLVFGLDLGLGRPARVIRNFYGYHLLHADAVALSAGPGRDDMPLLGAENAQRMAVIDSRPYRLHIEKQGSYVVRLGDHRLVMIDSGQDVGITEGHWDAFQTWLTERADENKEAFVGGSPNSEGVDGDELKLVNDTLAEMPADGLFILGIHAPLVSIWNNVHPYFLRETQRPVHAGQVDRFLIDHGATVANRPLREQHPGWFSADGNPEATFVKRGTTDDLLDYGVSRGQADDLLRALAGVGSARKADVVLTGHNHSHNEIRIGVGAEDELAYHLDFYTANPRNYYPTRFYLPASDVTYVELAKEAEPGANPSRMPHEAMFKYHLRVPPYHNPLSHTHDPRVWWAEHRPLMLQTAPLGPLEDNQASFNGFRVLTVRNDVIDKIHFVSIERLEQHGYRLEWADAIRPEPERAHRHVERSRAGGGPPGTGMPTAIVSPPTGEALAVYRGDNRHLHELWRLASGDVGQGDLTAAGGALDAAGNPSIYVNPSAQTHIVLFRDSNRNVNSLYWTIGKPEQDRLSETARAPKAAGDPVGYYTPETDTHHVVYVGDQGQLHTLYWVGNEPAQYGDTSASTGAPPAVGVPSPFHAPGVNIIVYRSRDKHVRTAYWSNDRQGSDDLSGFARTPDAAGDPVAYYYAADNTQQVTYRGVDNHLYELVWVGAEPTAGWDLTAAAGAPPAAGDPAALSIAATNTKHVVYRTADGHLHEISWVRGRTDAVDLDLTVAVIAPLAANYPHRVAFTIDHANRRHVFYTGDDNHVHEIVWS